MTVQPGEHYVIGLSQRSELVVPLTAAQLDDIILSNPDTFTVQYRDDRGQDHVYRGRDLLAFMQHDDAKRHEHKIFRNGNLIYHRTSSGQIVLGAHAGEVEKWARKQKVGRTALTGVGIFRESLRKAIDFNMRNLRGG